MAGRKRDGRDREPQEEIERLEAAYARSNAAMVRPSAGLGIGS